jgi:opacity protein-like surface antigen
MTGIKAACLPILLLVGIVSADHSTDQKKFDLFLATGYGFGVGGYYSGASRTYSGTTLMDREDHYENFGWGIKVEGGADYLLMDHVYGLAAINYSISAVPGTENKQDILGTSTTSEKFHWSVFGTKLGIKPTFKVLDLLDVYTTFGIGLYFASSGADLKMTESAGGVSTSKAEDSNNPAMTLIAAIGVEYPISESVIAYGEINCEQMSFTTTKTEYSNSVGGFYNDYVVNYQEDVTDRNPPPKIPGTNIALRVGVRFPLF